MANYNKITTDQPTLSPMIPVNTMNDNRITDQQTALSPTGPGAMLLGPRKSTVMCPFCNIAVETTVKHYATTRTHIAAALCLSICCCCIPYCSDSAKDTVHYCPVCNNYLGSYKK